MSNNIYTNYAFQMSELKHQYGSNVHLSSDPVLLTQLARLSQPETVQPLVSTLVRELYRSLVQTLVANEFPRCKIELPTRMAEATPKGVWTGDIVKPTTQVVTAGVARAGTLPSQVTFEFLSQLLEPAGIRQDHIYMARVTDDSGQVTGVTVAGSKIGGDIRDAFVLLPDPMGATGGSMSKAISMYKDIGKEHGAPMKIACLNLIITPEYVKRITHDHPDVLIYALRLDRGLSSDEILERPLGEFWSEETGLDEHQYIVPGAGGVGEVLNNSFV